MQYDELKYVTENDDPSITIETEEISARIIDGSGIILPPQKTGSRLFYQEGMRVTDLVHNLGFHGIHEFYSKIQRRNIVAPFISWLNLQNMIIEGIDNDPSDERAFGTSGARGWPIKIEEKGKGAILFMKPLSKTKVEYSIEFQPAEPDGIDFITRFLIKGENNENPSNLTVSWPLYTNALDDVHFYYPCKEQEEGWKWKTIGENPEFILGRTVHFKHDYKYLKTEHEHYYVGYGRIGEYALILMHDEPGMNFYVNTAGGHYSFSSVQNPAWGFMWTKYKYTFNKSFGFRGRIIYTKYENDEKVIDRYNKWIKGD
jgi:hypothetical protein